MAWLQLLSISGSHALVGANKQDKLAYGATGFEKLGKKKKTAFLVNLLSLYLCFLIYQLRNVLHGNFF